MSGDLGTVVDVHHHWLPREISDNLEKLLPEGYRVTRDDHGVAKLFDQTGTQVFTVDPEAYASISRRLEHMDAAGIDVALLSAACYPSWITLKAARLINDAAADLLRQYGARLRPMVHVPPFGEEGILGEMERAAKLGLHGLCIATNFKGLYPDEEAYLPLLKKAADLNLPVFTHAAGSPVTPGDLRKYDLGRSLGRSMEHCLVTVRMLYSGVMAGLPNLKMVMPHLGGSFSSSVKRYLDRPADAQKAPPGGYRPLLDRMLFDTAPSFWYGPIEIECAVKNLGPSHVALGSDYPAHPASADAAVLKDAVEHIRKLALDDADKRKVAGENSGRLYGLN